MSNLSNPFVSVIIPVYNDPEHLKICLNALENQTYPKSSYEVIVVDNGSDESIEGIVNQFGQAVATYESRIGSYAARNKGISLAKGDIIAFTDADCIPASDWIEKGVANLLSVPNCGLVAGKVELFFKNEKQPNAVELFESIGWWASQKESLEHHRYGATANLFTFKSVLDVAGCFDDTLKSHGDIEWGQRIFALGYKQIYADDTSVSHPCRTSLAKFSKKVVRLLGGELDRKKKKGYSSKEFLIDLANDLKPPLRVYFCTFKDERLKGIQKIKYLLIYVYIKYLQAGERIRLQIKGSSRRG